MSTVEQIPLETRFARARRLLATRSAEDALRAAYKEDADDLVGILELVGRVADASEAEAGEYKNPAVKFAQDVRDHVYDYLDDYSYNYLLERVEAVSKFWNGKAEAPGERIVEAAIIHTVLGDPGLHAAILEKVFHAFAYLALGLETAGQVDDDWSDDD